MLFGVAVVLALAAAALAARSGADERTLARDLAAARGWRLVPVSARQVRSYPPDSPERTFAQFWRDLQLGDSQRAWSHLGPSARTDTARRLVLSLAGTAAKVGLPPDLLAVRRGRRATIELEIVVAQPIRRARYLGPRRWAPRVPLLIDFARRSGQWQIVRARGSVRPGELPREVLP
ncbi:hypothetical protein HRbin41_00398 [bacterium HR41]|nr:hypothetical protein HRbin41_00398 [bacterium HR41]